MNTNRFKPSLGYRLGKFAGSIIAAEDSFWSGFGRIGFSAGLVRVIKISARAIAALLLSLVSIYLLFPFLVLGFSLYFAAKTFEGKADAGGIRYSKFVENTFDYDYVRDGHRYKNGVRLD